MKKFRSLRRARSEKGQVLAEFALTLVIFLMLVMLTIDSAYILLQKVMFKYAVSEGEWVLSTAISEYEDTANSNKIDYLTAKGYGKDWSTNQIRNAVLKANRSLHIQNQNDLKLSNVRLSSVGFERAYEAVFLDQGKTDYYSPTNLARNATITANYDTEHIRNLTDGDYKTKWGPVNEDVESSELIFDFGKQQSLKQITFYWDWRGNYTIEGQNKTGYSWTAIKTQESAYTTGTDGQVQDNVTTVTFSANYRYYRIKLKKDPDNNKYSVKLNEIVMSDTEGYNTASTNYQWRVLTASADMTYSIKPLTPFGHLIFGDVYTCSEKFYVERLVGGTSK